LIKGNDGDNNKTCVSLHVKCPILHWNNKTFVIKSSRAVSRVNSLSKHNVSGNLSVTIIRWHWYALQPHPARHMYVKN
jgi:hypothetical protein